MYVHFPCIIEWVKITHDKQVWKVGLVFMLNVFWKQSEGRDLSVSGLGLSPEWVKDAWATSLHIGDDFLSTIQILGAEECFAMSILETWCTSLNLPALQVWGCRCKIRNWKLAVREPSRKIVFYLACRYLFLIKLIVKNQNMYYKKNHPTFCRLEPNSGDCSVMKR